MSLEKAIEENNALLRELIALKKGERVEITGDAAPDKPAAKKPAKETAKETKPAAVEDGPANKDSDAYKTAAKAVTDAVQRVGRDKVFAVLASFNKDAKNLVHLKQSQLAGVQAQCEALQVEESVV